MNLRGPKIGIIIQARVGSTRLPRKVLKPLYQSKSILDIILSRFAAVPYPVILATSNVPADDAIAMLAEANGVTCYRGSEQNVLERFIKAAKLKDFDYVIRICADNPFLSKELFDDLLAEAQTAQFDFDYLSFAYLAKPTILTHFGFFVELVRTKALQRALKETNKTIYLEHVTNYIYQHPDRFKVKFVELDPSFVIDPNIRMTVDTAEDFELAVELYQTLMNTYGNVTLGAINDHLAKHPKLVERMKKQIQLNEK